MYISIYVQCPHTPHPHKKKFGGAIGGKKEERRGREGGL